MRKVILIMGGYISNCLFVLRLLVVMFLASISFTNAYADLLFFKAIEDKITYNKNPAKYDRVIFPPRWGREEVYVERTPILRIEIKEIKSVLIEKEKVYKDTREAVEEALGLRPTRNEKEKKGEKDAFFTYRVTFSLSEPEAKKFKHFVDKHLQELFDFRLRNKRIGVVTLLGPFQGRDFTVSLLEDDINRLKEIFSPVQDKVTWK